MAVRRLLTGYRPQSYDYKRDWDYDPDEATQLDGTTHAAMGLRDDSKRHGRNF